MDLKTTLASVWASVLPTTEGSHEVRAQLLLWASLILVKLGRCAIGEGATVEFVSQLQEDVLFCRL